MQNVPYNKIKYIINNLLLKKKKLNFSKLIYKKFNI